TFSSIATATSRYSEKAACKSWERYSTGSLSSKSAGDRDISEELIAEMGAAYLCAEAGISNAVLENQAAYVAGWLKKLRDDRRLLIHAAAQAQRAADYILNRTCHE